MRTLQSNARCTCKRLCVECLSALLQNLGPEELAEATGALRQAREELGLPLDEISFCGTVMTIGTGEMFAACCNFYKGIMDLEECEQSDSEVCCLVCLLEISMFVVGYFQNCTVGVFETESSSSSATRC